jgi:hypothetical protein
MATQVTIANLALMNIGAPTITRVEAETASGRAVRAGLDLALEGFLCMHPWTFAVTRTTTSPTANTPDHNYTYEHAFPSDAIYVFPPGEGRQPYDDYKIEGRTLLSNSDTLKIRYIKNDVSVSDLPPLAANALAIYLAWWMCMALVQGNTGRREKERLWNDFEKALAKARYADSSQLAGVNATDFTLDDARHDGVNQLRDLT